MRLWASALVVLLCACDSEEGNKTAADAVEDTGYLDEIIDDETCSSLTWENFGEGYMRSWCSGCHHPELDEDDRQGAPVGIDFNTQASVVRWAERIIERAAGENPSMPPVGGSSPEERERLEIWLRCEAQLGGE